MASGMESPKHSALSGLALNGFRVDYKLTLLRLAPNVSQTSFQKLL